MKLTLRLFLPILVFIAARSEFANCLPLSLDVADNTNNGGASSTSSPAELQPSKQETAPPPLIFPEDSSVYKIVENDTALKILQARSAVAETPAEGQKVQQKQPAATAAGESTVATGSNKNNGTSSLSSSSVKSKNGQEDESDDGDDYSTENDDDDSKDDYDNASDEDGDTYDTEDVQPADPLKEDGLEEQFGNKESHYPLVLDNTMIEVSAMRTEHIWIIMLGAVFVLALAAYIAMVLYRNRLEQRYGMRQRLVTEDDFYTNNDI